MADGAALAVGDVHLLAVAHIFALDLVAQHLAVVAHADATRLRLPDVAVGVHLAVGRAALFITWWRRGGVNGGMSFTFSPLCLVSLVQIWFFHIIPRVCEQHKRFKLCFCAAECICWLV